MIDIQKLAAGFAANVARTSNIPSEAIEPILRDAFQRGLQLGLTLRKSADLGVYPKIQPTKEERQSWTMMH
ncbi:hypothetical protein RZS28_18515 (plasmid) [Methylocapsa polymorpha]|uniref:Uncharacterized protein n=1 Tax=Methylocapsa polymorpha TaxID=3080828 RepID=A0ABZ0HWR4_9HYPH|nr:hypothetical protein [Methylocapsa sp. RX1]WOJ91722.1 hypothetical protein RZS28_18515 [Methylocapsa sp. RX1]